MKITIEFKDVDEYIEFKEKTAQEQLLAEPIYQAESIYKCPLDFVRFEKLKPAEI